MNRPIPHPDDNTTSTDALKGITLLVNRWKRVPGDSISGKTVDDMRKKYAVNRDFAVNTLGFSAEAFRAEVERRAKRLHGETTPTMWCDVSREVVSWCEAVISYDKHKKIAEDKQVAAYAKGPTTLIPLIVEDSGWKGTQVGRCIADFHRVIKFSRDLIPTELTEIMVWLKNVDCPGWTGVLSRGSGAEWRFTTTHDSSD